MTDKEYEKQKKRVRKLTRKWIKPLGLHWWRIDQEYWREEKTATSYTYKPPSVKGKWTCLFDVSTDYYYKTALINCYLPSIVGVNDEDLEEYYLHELMHIFLSPMKTPKTEKEEELVATSLARAFIWSQKK